MSWKGISKKYQTVLSKKIIHLKSNIWKVFFWQIPNRVLTFLPSINRAMARKSNHTLSILCCSNIHLLALRFATIWTQNLLTHPLTSFLNNGVRMYYHRLISTVNFLTKTVIEYKLCYLWHNLLNNIIWNKWEIVQLTVNIKSNLNCHIKYKANY